MNYVFFSQKSQTMFFYFKHNLYIATLFVKLVNKVKIYKIQLLK